jgi:hypothetical protein
MLFLLYAKTRQDASTIDPNIRRQIELKAISFFLNNEEPEEIRCEHVWGRATDYGGWVAIVETAKAESLWDLVTGRLAILFEIKVEPLVQRARPTDEDPDNLRRLIPESLGNGHW